MVQTRNVAKRQKIEECTSCMESVMFNSDSLFKIASYLPANSFLNLAFLMPTIWYISSNESLSLVEETARRIVQDILQQRKRWLHCQMAALPGYGRENWLCKYNYLQSLRIPLTFDQLSLSRLNM